MKKKLSIVVGSLFLLYANISGQQDWVEAFKKNTVAINEGEKGQNGSGFIIGRKKNNLVILTAQHIIANRSAVQVTFIDKKEPITATVENENAYFDIALLSVPALGIDWKPYPFVDNVSGGDSAFIFSVPRGMKGIPENESGVVADLDKDNLVLKLRGVIGGDSGTPLWNKNGLIGMIYTRTPVQARPVALIRRFLEEDWEISWQLIRKNIYHPPPRKDPPPDIKNEITIPVSRISCDACIQDLSNLIDGNLVSSWNCEIDGLRNVTLYWSLPQTIRKIKLYMHDDNPGDLPQGSVVIYGVKEKKTLAKLLTENVEKERNGLWYTYDLGAYYLTTQLTLLLKIKKNTSTNKITPLKLNEIRLTGLK